MEDNEKKELTLEELMAIASAPISLDDKQGDLSEAHKFLIANNLTSGEVRNFTTDVYEAYRKWARKPVDKFEFGRQINKLVKNARTGAGRYYLLNRKINEK